MTKGKANKKSLGSPKQRWIIGLGLALILMTALGYFFMNKYSADTIACTETPKLLKKGEMKVTFVDKSKKVPELKIQNLVALEVNNLNSIGAYSPIVMLANRGSFKASFQGKICKTSGCQTAVKSYDQIFSKNPTKGNGIGLNLYSLERKCANTKTKTSYFVGLETSDGTLFLKSIGFRFERTAKKWNNLSTVRIKYPSATNESSANQYFASLTSKEQKVNYSSVTLTKTYENLYGKYKDTTNSILDRVTNFLN